MDTFLTGDLQAPSASISADVPYNRDTITSHSDIKTQATWESPPHQRPLAIKAQHLVPRHDLPYSRSSPESAMTTFLEGFPLLDPTASILYTTSMPSTTAAHMLSHYQRNTFHMGHEYFWRGKQDEELDVVPYSS